MAAAGMAATMVLSPMFVDETFAVQIVAHTGDPSYALAAWQLTFLYDETVLELQSTSFSTLFKDVTLNDQTAGQVIANTADLAAGVAASQVSNKVDLYIATITLKVLGSVAAGDYRIFFIVSVY